MTPYWYADRSVLAIATGLAYPNKGIYPKQNPKVALLFSDSTGSGLNDVTPVLVKGDAVVLDEDIQANTDRYVVELREKFPAARLALNAFTVKLLDFYLPRIWVELNPVDIAPPKPEPPVASGEVPRSQRSRLGAKEAAAMEKVARGHDSVVVTVRGDDGYPSMIRSVARSTGASRVELDRIPGQGAACLTWHHHSVFGTRFHAYMARGEIFGNTFVARRLVGFFGNGAVFPLSVLPHIRNLRRRLHEELRSRRLPMPELRVPRAHRGR